jgi:hypothetical protein
MQPLSFAVALAAVPVVLVQAVELLTWGIAGEVAQVLTDTAAYNSLWVVAHSTEVEPIAHSDMFVA